MAKEHICSINSICLTRKKFVLFPFEENMFEIKGTLNFFSVHMYSQKKDGKNKKKEKNLHDLYIFPTIQQ